MPAVPTRRNPASATSPATFRAAWEISEHDQRRRQVRRQRVRKWARRLVVLAVLGVGVYVAYPRVHTLIVTRSLPAELRAYVSGGGATYQPITGPYSVRFPKAPTGSLVPVAPGSLAAPILVRETVASGPDYRVALWDAELPGGALPMGALGALRDPALAGRGALADVHEADIAGERAYVGTFTTANAAPRRVGVLVHGGRLYVIRVQAKSVSPVFDAAVHALRFTSP